MSDPGKAVFLSYASQDAGAAQRLCDALRAAGVEVWFDRSELVGGDAWDQKIRKQIKDCALLIPIISQNTQARTEGYFRLEWRLADQRTHLMAKGRPFLLPVVIDETPDAEAHVPDSFTEVQWTRLRDSEGGAAFATRVKKLLGGEVAPVSDRRPVAAPDPAGGQRPALPGKQKPIWVWLGPALVIALIVFGWVKQRARREETGEAAESVTASAATRTETPRLTAQVSRSRDGGDGSIDATVRDKSVAVLAFKNLSDDKANEYFSDGVSEELLTVLQKIPGLRVSSRTSAFSFKGRDVSVQEIGHALGVAYLIEGSVRKSGDKVRVTARLSQAETGRQLWSENYTRDLEDVFVLQTELAQTIVGQFREQLTGTDDVDNEDVVAQVRAAQKGGTKNIAAHELYLQGRYFANQMSLENLGKAVDLLQRAVDLDPDFALAWGALARSVALQTQYLTTTPETLRESFARARRAADRAIALAPKLPDGYFARFEIQLSYDFDWRGAKESLQTAMSLAPGDALLISNASQLTALFGDFPRSLELGRRAANLDPVNPEIRYWLGRTYFCAGLLAEGEAELRRAADLSPSLLSVHRQLALVLASQGRAVEAVAEAKLEKDEWSRQAALAVACWAAKDVPAADAALARLIEIGTENAAYQVGQTYGFRGEIDAAFRWLDRAYRNRDSGFGSLRVDPLLKGLHSDPRWVPFLRQSGLADEQVK